MLIADVHRNVEMISLCFGCSVYSQNEELHKK